VRVSVDSLQGETHSSGSSDADAEAEADAHARERKSEPKYRVYISFEDE
jgi:hypothetical protein